MADDSEAGVPETEGPGHRTCSGAGSDVVPPSDVLVHGRGGLGKVLEVLQDVEDTLLSSREAASAAQTSRKFDSANEFKGLVKRVREGQATVVLRKLFLWSGQCSVMQEIWIQDKRNPDARSNPFKSYAVVHVHHHWQTRVARSEDIKPAHLAIVDAVNARHICDSASFRYQDDNPFFNTCIEPSGADTLKVFPLQEWPCPKCGLKNFQSRPACRGRGAGAPCAGARPCTSWKWKADSARDADLALILAEADKTLQWPSGSGKSEHRGAGDTYPQVHADRLDSLMSEYRTRRPRRDLATAVLQNTGPQRPCPDECESWHNLHAAVLCIGLGQYTAISRLPNAVKDARELHAQANAVPGCRAELLENLESEKAIRVGIQKFFDRKGLQETPPKFVCIVCSGHGMQIGATVYLLPEGADPNDRHCRPDKEFFALSDIFHCCDELDSHARRLENPHAVTFVVIVDACREFGQKDYASMASSLDPE